MTINSNQIIALVMAAVVGNALILQLWSEPPAAERKRRKRLFDGLLLAIFPLAVVYAGLEMYWNRSEDVMLALLLYLPLQAIFTTKVFFDYNRRCGLRVGWWRLLSGNLLLLVVLVTSLFAVGEVYFRFFYNTTDSFGYTKVTQRWIKHYYHQNQAKLRDNIEYERTIQSGKRRVSFVGDSFTAGHGIKNVDDRFANRIRRLHSDWEVHVLAGNGWDTGAEIKFLNGESGLGYQMDQVVLVYCLNDVNDLLTDWGPVLDTAAGKRSHRMPFCEDSYFLDFLYHRLVIARLPWVRNYFSFVTEAYGGERWKTQQERLRALRSVVESHGGKLCVVTFPFLNALGAHYEYQFIHDELNAFWREQNVPHLDLLPLFKDYAPARLTVNAFDAHPNEFANQLAAERINAFLVEQMKTNPRPATLSNQVYLNPQSY